MLSGIFQHVMDELGVTVFVNRMSPSKSKISRKMTPNTEEHDEDLQFRNGGRLERG